MHFCIEAEAFPFDPQPGADVQLSAEALILRAIYVGRRGYREYRRRTGMFVPNLLQPSIR